MAARTSRIRPILVVILAIAIVLVAMPQSWKGWAPGFIKNAGLHLGLDLVGGTQLDFRISEEEIRQQQAAVTQEIEQKKAKGGSADEIAKLQNLAQRSKNLITQLFKFKTHFNVLMI